MTKREPWNLNRPLFPSAMASNGSVASLAPRPSNVLLFQRQCYLKGFSTSLDCQGDLVPDAVVIQNPQQVGFAFNLFSKRRYKGQKKEGFTRLAHLKKPSARLQSTDYTGWSELHEEALTGLPSTAVMISPRTILPAKPLLVGARPALAAALPPGTYYRERSDGIREYHRVTEQIKHWRHPVRPTEEKGTPDSIYLQDKSSVADIKLICYWVWSKVQIQASTADLKREMKNNLDQNKLKKLGTCFNNE